MHPDQANNVPEPHFQPELQYQRYFAVITETGTNSVSIQSADRIIVGVCGCWYRFWLLLFIGYSFLYEVSIAAVKLRELKLQKSAKNLQGVGWSFGVCIFQMSSAVHPLPDWLGLLYFPIGVSEWVSSADVIKFADASFFHTGRKRWGFKRLCS